jgi:frataxin-like iron-binding protein CyaY
MRPLVLTKEALSMKTRNRKPAPYKKSTEGQVMKLQVDYRTTIIVRSQKALEMWMGKYPNAKIVA